MLINQELLDKVSAEAVVSPRKRKNFNFHGSDTALSHRLLNAIEPGSYIVPHRHLDPNKDETMIALRGQLGIVLFDETGRVSGSHVLEAGSECCGITIAHGMFHSALALHAGTIMFESKGGPFLPLTADEIAPWAPAEMAKDAEVYIKKLTALFS